MKPTHSYYIYGTLQRRRCKVMCWLLKKNSKAFKVLIRKKVAEIWRAGRGDPVLQLQRSIVFNFSSSCHF